MVVNEKQYIVISWDSILFSRMVQDIAFLDRDVEYFVPQWSE